MALVRRVERSGRNVSNFESIVELVERGRVLVLTGAGVSTESGIPDYRDELGAWKHRQPMQYREFISSEAARRRYWARSLAGWPRFRSATPNAAHTALAELERKDRTAGLVTQNVDGLHSAAGSRDVVDLHGRLDRVTCLGCGQGSSRDRFQELLGEANPGWVVAATTFTPDGDADLGEADTAAFQVPDCSQCGGIIKPDVVFFGEHVPKERVERAMSALASARSLLVVGSSLMVFSGYRFVRAAARAGLPIALLNRGKTRADEIAHLKLEDNAGTALARIASRVPPASK